MKSVTSWIGRTGIIAVMFMSMMTGAAIADPGFALAQYSTFPSLDHCLAYAEAAGYELYECRAVSDAYGQVVYELILYEDT